MKRSNGSKRRLTFTGGLNENVVLFNFSDIVDDCRIPYNKYDPKLVVNKLNYMHNGLRLKLPPIKTNYE